jgi:hypothetical protein
VCCSANGRGRIKLDGVEYLIMKEIDILGVTEAAAERKVAFSQARLLKSRRQVFFGRNDHERKGGTILD